jgi:hypothetical protein
LPVFWRRLSTRAWPTRPKPFGSSVPRANVTATSGQLSALADGAALRMALGATVRTAAATTAAAPRPAQRKRLDQARRDAKRVLRLMLTRRFYGFPGRGSYPRFSGGWLWIGEGTRRDQYIS